MAMITDPTPIGTMTPKRATRTDPVIPVLIAVVALIITGISYSYYQRVHPTSADNVIQMNGQAATGNASTNGTANTTDSGMSNSTTSTNTANTNADTVRTDTTSTMQAPITNASANITVAPNASTMETTGNNSANTTTNGQ